MNKLMKIVTRYKESKLQAIIAKTSKTDEKKATAYAKRSTYVNPCALYIG
jgi:hypothetical protein